MATEKQQELFNRLADERDFGEGVDTSALKLQFNSLPDKSASAWIEKALSKPEKGDVPPPF